MADVRALPARVLVTTTPDELRRLADEMEARAAKVEWGQDRTTHRLLADSVEGPEVHLAVDNDWWWESVREPRASGERKPFPPGDPTVPTGGS